MRLAFVLLALGPISLAPLNASAQVALVRLVPLDSAPEGWLQMEEVMLERANERLAKPARAPSVAGDLWQAPGYKFDRARVKIREALEQADLALEGGRPRDAIKALADVTDLLQLRPVVAVMPARIIQRYHFLEARARKLAGDSKATRAIQNYLSLNGLDAQDAVTERFRADVPAAAADDAGSLTVEGRGGTIYIDGVMVGPAPVKKHPLAPGVHYLRVMARGRVAKGERFKLPPGKSIRREVFLDVASDPLRERASALNGDRVSSEVMDGLVELAVDLESTQLVLLIPSTRERAFVARRFDVQTSELGTSVEILFDGDAVARERLIDQIVGASAEPELELLDATATDAVARQPVRSPLLEKKAEDSGSTRWVLLGVGVAVVVGAVIAVVAATAGGTQANKAQVFLCPDTGSGSCAR